VPNENHNKNNEIKDKSDKNDDELKKDPNKSNIIRLLKSYLAMGLEQFYHLNLNLQVPAVKL